MHASEAHDRRDEVQLLDVREQHEWDAGHIPDAVHVPMGQLDRRLDELSEERLIVCVCRSGHRSAAVASALTRAGYAAENLEGGMQDWHSHGFDVVATGGDQGRVI